MTNTFLFANGANSTLAGAITNTATTLNVSAGSGVLFPSPSSGQQFSATLVDAATGLVKEIIYVIGVSTDTFTVIRGQEGTTARSWLSGDYISNWLTAGQMSAMLQTNAVPTFSTTGQVFFGVDTGVPDSLVATVAPTISSYTDGQVFEITVANANLTATPVINISSLGSKTITRADGTALAPGELMAGVKQLFAYNGGTSKVVLLGPSQRFIQNTSQSQSLNWVGAVTGTNNYTASGLVLYSGAMTNGVRLVVVPANTNTGACTLITPYGTFNIREADGTVLSGGEMKASQVVDMMYNGTNLVIMSLLPLSFLLAYIEANIPGGYLPLSGGTMTGNIILAGDATTSLEPVSLEQLNTAVQTNSPFLTTGIGAAIEINIASVGGTGASDSYGVAVWMQGGGALSWGSPTARSVNSGTLYYQNATFTGGGFNLTISAVDLRWQTSSPPAGTWRIQSVGLTTSDNQTPMMAIAVRTA